MKSGMRVIARGGVEDEEGRVLGMAVGGGR